MLLISSFDPWRSGLCRCFTKLTFNPYTSCDHQCLYCYATNYIPNFKQIHHKKECFTMIRKEAIKLTCQTISLYNSSDPYPKIEAPKGLTRRCIEILADYNRKIHIITKSNLVTRDDDLLCHIHATLTLTITTDNKFIANILEPNAPTPNQPIQAAQDFQKADIPASVCIDPLIQHINNQPPKPRKTLDGIGVKHITCFTYKAKPDNWNRLNQALSKVMEQLNPLLLNRG